MAEAVVQISAVRTDFYGPDQIGTLPESVSHGGRPIGDQRPTLTHKLLCAHDGWIQDQWPKWVPEQRVSTDTGSELNESDSIMPRPILTARYPTYGHDQSSEGEMRPLIPIV